MSCLKSVIILASFLILPSYLPGQDRLVIERLREEPRLDGNVFEPAWDSLPSYPMIMLNPTAGKAPSQKSDFKIGYTDKYLLVAVYMYDTDPDKIRAASKMRDEMGLSNDWFGISFDTYNDNENALFFATTPAGLRLDGQIFNDGQASFPVQRDWNTVWEVKTSLTGQGWFAEIEIPLSSLRYRIENGKTVMGMNAFRYISRLAEWDIFPATSNEWGFWSFAKPSQYMDAELSGVKSINPLYFTPYLLGGLQSNYSLNKDETAYIAKTSWEKAIGIDAKIGLSKNLTLDLTLNTDFAQVEADDEQINLTRFSLYFPEKRQFFLERSSIFDFTFGPTGYLFYSRRIGIDNEQQVPIWGGGRLISRVGPWDIGFMSLQTGNLTASETGDEPLPSMNNSVLRIRKKVTLNENSYLGGMVTSKVDVHGNYNIGYGIDAILNLHKNDYLNIAMARTMDTDSANWDPVQPTKIYAQLERRSYQGISYDLNYTKAGSRYDPCLGFEYRSDFSRYGMKLGLGFIPGDRSAHIKRHKGYLNSYMYTRNTNQSIESVEVEPGYELVTKTDHTFTLSFPVSYESISEDFELASDVTIPAGEYPYYNLQFSYASPSGKWLYMESHLSSGKFYDGWINSFSLSPNLTLGESWNIYLSYSLNDIHFRTRNTYLLTHLAGIKLLYMYSTSLSASSYLQYNSLSNDFIWNVRFRFNPREGNDFYIVYNDNINSERKRSEPTLPFSNQRAILLKYTYTFRVR
jgi:hypothetical protein